MEFSAHILKCGMIPLHHFNPDYLIKSVVTTATVLISLCTSCGRPRWLSGKESAWQGRRHRRLWFDPWVVKIHGEGNGNPLQFSCLEYSMDRGAWQATVHGVVKSWT